MNALQKYRFCFLAGLCAAGGSFFGKLPSFLKDSTFYVEDIALLPATFQTYGGKFKTSKNVCFLLFDVTRIL